MRRRGWQMELPLPPPIFPSRGASSHAIGSASPLAAEDTPGSTASAWPVLYVLSVEKHLGRTFQAAFWKNLFFVTNSFMLFFLKRTCGGFFESAIRFPNPVWLVTVISAECRTVAPSARNLGHSPLGFPCSFFLAQSPKWKERTILLS